METLTRGEQGLFAKYWGVKDLEESDEFWEDAYQVFLAEQINVALPLKYNPTAVRMVLDILDCPPGKCGECCRYMKIPISQHDIERIEANTSVAIKEIVQVKDGEYHLNGDGGCPFLKDNSCTIHKCRPDTCYLFPIQTATTTWSVDGEPIQQMHFRIKCRPSMAIVKNIILKAMSPERMLLPNLILISNEGADMKK